MGREAALARPSLLCRPTSESFGVAESTDATDLEDLLVRADRALFAAKRAGRDCICIDGHSIAVAPNLTAIN